MMLIPPLQKKAIPEFLPHFHLQLMGGGGGGGLVTVQQGILDHCVALGAGGHSKEAGS